MELRFMKMGDKGGARYVHDTDEYEWYYDGSETKIENLLSDLDDGRNYTKITTHGQANVGGDLSVQNENTSLKSWDEHIEQLAKMLRRNGCDILYLGSV